MVAYIGKIVSRHVADVPRGERYAHIKCRELPRELVILESGWYKSHTGGAHPALLLAVRY